MAIIIRFYKSFFYKNLKEKINKNIIATEIITKIIKKDINNNLFNNIIIISNFKKI